MSVLSYNSEEPYIAGQYQQFSLEGQTNWQKQSPGLSYFLKLFPIKEINLSIN